MTRDTGWSAEGAEVAGDVESALRLAGDNVSVIGGAEIFRLFLPLAQRIELTEVLEDVDGDTVLDGPRTADWREVWSEVHPAESPPFRFVTLERA